MKWAVIEEAGMDRETVRRDDFTDMSEAIRWMNRTYPSALEREVLHVDVAKWDAEGEFWSYDY